MKLQIHGQRLRLRIDEDELQRLLAEEVLCSPTVLPGDRMFRISLQLCTRADAAFTTVGNAWRVALPRDAVAEYVGRLPCRDGLEFDLPTGGADALRLGFEVDIRDSVRRRLPRPRK